MTATYASYERMVEMCDLLAATLENVMAHHGDKMPEGDRSSREAAVAEARALIDLARGELGLNDHAAPGEYCPNCETVHCTDDDGHEWNRIDNFCIKCGADGQA